MKNKVRATARPIFEAVATRLDIDSALLEYLFRECLNDVLVAAHNNGYCTIRGLGKFRMTTLSQLAQAHRPALPVESQALGAVSIMAFERTRHIIKHSPFSALRLKTRMGKKFEGNQVAPPKTIAPTPLHD